MNESETYTFAQIEALLRQPPPREVPEEAVSLICISLAKRSSLPIAARLGLLGGLIFIIPVIFSDHFARLGWDWRLCFEATNKTAGQIYSLKKQRIGGRMKYRCEFSYQPRETTDAAPPLRNFVFSACPKYEIGQNTEVEYLLDHPQMAILKGTFLSPYTGTQILLLLLVLIFIGVQLAEYIYGKYFFPRFVKLLLTDGQLLPAIITTGKAGLLRIRWAQFSYKLNGRSRTKRWTWQADNPKRNQLIGRLSQGAEVTILVHPSKPAEVIFLTALAGEG